MVLNKSLPTTLNPENKTFLLLQKTSTTPLESFKSFVAVFTGSWKNVQPVPMAFEIVYLPAQVGKAVQDPWAGIQEQEIYRMCIELLRSLIHFLMSRQDAFTIARL